MRGFIVELTIDGGDNIYSVDSKGNEVSTSRVASLPVKDLLAKLISQGAEIFFDEATAETFRDEAVESWIDDGGSPAVSGRVHTIFVDRRGLHVINGCPSHVKPADYLKRMQLSCEEANNDD